MRETIFSGQRYIYSVALAVVFAAMFIPARGARILITAGMTTPEVNLLLNQALPGDSLQFEAGMFSGHYFLRGVHGEPDNPVVILGQLQNGALSTVIDGGTVPGMEKEDYAFYFLHCSWINIEQLEIRNCWTDLIRADQTSYLSIRHCRMFGGKRALFATGRDSHHFLIEHCNWEQDKRIWTHLEGYTWDEVHHGIHEHYNGSLFQGSGIGGTFVLRDNQIRNTFNAFRLSRIDDGELDLLACTNGEIYRNKVINTADNVLEPEVHVKNLHYYHNRMINGHAFISITEVAGGDIYIYGNTAVNLPGEEDAWTILKISNRVTGLSAPLWIFHNSWVADRDLVGRNTPGWTNHFIRHYNNAIVSENADTLGVYNLGEDNRFDFDCSSAPFPNLLTSRAMERNGIVADPLFRDPWGGDFRLRESSPCIDRGKVLEEFQLPWKGDRPDIGAYNNDTLVEGPPFRFMIPDEEVSYRELPRIVRHRVEGNELHLWFSIPLAPQSLRLINLALEKEEGIIPLKIKELSLEGYHLVLIARAQIGENILCLSVSRQPVGVNGMKATSWASTLPVCLVPGNELSSNIACPGDHPDSPQ